MRFRSFAAKYSFSALAVTLALPHLAFAAPQSYGELAGLFVTIINVATETAIALVFSLYFFGTVREFQKISSGEAGKRREFFVWGLFTLFVMVSVGGILALLENTFFGASSSMSSGSIPVSLGGY